MGGRELMVMVGGELHGISYFAGITCLALFSLLELTFTGDEVQVI